MDNTQNPKVEAAKGAIRAGCNGLVVEALINDLAQLRVALDEANEKLAKYEKPEASS